ncbi:MAG: AraC family transcriptional regulator [Candidatus Thiodiazotropha sp. (ex Ctena orbiculata)]|nr:AraC family transcriptional regulator [Candidatus Thiodiazotropha taylori]
MTGQNEIILESLQFEAELAFVGNVCERLPGYNRYDGGFLHFIRSGNASLDLPDTPSLSISEPTLVFFPRPGFHRINPVDVEGVNLVCARIKFRGGGLNPLAESFPPYLAVPLGQLQDIGSVLPILFDEALSGELGHVDVVQSACVIIFVNLVRHLIETTEIPKHMVRALQDKNISMALAYIHNNYTAAITARSIAGGCNLSRSQLYKKFREVMGITPNEYLAAYRMIRAQSLLANSLPISEVATSVGYSGSPAFIRKYKELVGCSPTKWKKGAQSVPSLDGLLTN